MRRITKNTVALSVVALLAVPMAAPSIAQQADTNPSIIVTGERVPALETLPAGPDIKGTITARKGDQMKVTTAEGQASVITIAETTRVKASSGLFGGKGKLTTAALLNGIPVTVKTLQWNGGLVAKEVTFKNNDYKTAMMIRNGTNQRFEENEAATEALRGRMADIDNYNLKGTTNVFFDTGKTILSEKGKADLCAAATTAEGTSNALLLVVGYTDSVGDEDYNQTLSEKRASRVINYLQQVCKWKPYRMLTPTGMAESDPLADNSTEEGRAQNRRVSVNILVSKSVDGI
mgnify:CR=1 FL=1